LFSAYILSLTPEIFAASRSAGVNSTRSFEALKALPPVDAAERLTGAARARERPTRTDRMTDFRIGVACTRASARAGRSTRASQARSASASFATSAIGNGSNRPSRSCSTRAPTSSVSLVISRSRSPRTRDSAPLDYLQRLTIIADDKLCDRLTASWGMAEHGCRVTVWQVVVRMHQWKDALPSMANPSLVQMHPCF